MTHKQLQWVDGVYVLSVKTFQERIEHITREMREHAIDFEFVFDYDVPDLEPTLLNSMFSAQSNLSLAEKSLILKHITAWKRAIERNQKNILVFEDDVVLSPNFKARLGNILPTIQQVIPGYLFYLGGENVRVPHNLLLTSELFFKYRLDTAEGYLTDYVALQRRIALLQNYLITLPADHLIRDLDHNVHTEHYWLKTPLVRQGSLYGLFQSSLDVKRMRRSPTFNYLRYRYQILKRRTIPTYFASLWYKIRHLKNRKAI